MGGMSFGLRLSVLGLAFIGLFAVLLLRLWDMQLVEAQAYQEQADSNLVRFVETPAPRGEVRDAQGRLIAGTRPALAAVVEGSLLPADDAALVQRLAAFTGHSVRDIQQHLDDARTRGDRVTLVAELSDEQATYLVEHDEMFPGVAVVPTPVRVYEAGALAPHVVGYIGRPDAADLEKPGISPTDVVGKAGVEREYDDVLRGDPGIVKYQVNAQGEILDTLGEQPPAPGRSLVLELDLDAQQVLTDALEQGLEGARRRYSPGGCEPGDEDPGCPVRAVGVVLNVDDGAVLAMASVPSFDPNMFVGSVAQEELDALPEGVFNNFAIQGQYAPASTFKSVTYVAAFEDGLLPRTSSFEEAGTLPVGRAPTLDDEIECSATLRADFNDRSRLLWDNWKFPQSDGLQDIHRALVKSCNIYFWDVALNLWNTHKGTALENQLQEWARSLGLGVDTGVDLPFERPGIIPDRALFEDWAANEPQRLDPARLELASPWLGGDLLQAAVGQGAVLVTPLQLAIAYAAMVNGGTVWQPRIVQRIVDEDGRLVLQNARRATNRVELAPATVLQLRRDLQQVVNGSDGTAYSAFADFGGDRARVGGKTGTAEVIKGRTLEDGTRVEPVNTAVFAAVAPVDDPEWVVVVIVERGGSGGSVAAPTAVPVLQYLLGGDAAVTEVVIGSEFLD
jgi:penicillin-binding protein 2